SLALDKSLDISSVNQLKWNLVISTDLSLTDGNVAACNIPAKVVYINPYFFELPKIKQLQILYCGFISYIVNNEADEAKAYSDSNSFFAPYSKKLYLKERISIEAIVDNVDIGQYEKYIYKALLSSQFSIIFPKISIESIVKVVIIDFKPSYGRDIFSLNIYLHNREVMPCRIILYNAESNLEFSIEGEFERLASRLVEKYRNFNFDECRGYLTGIGLDPEVIVSLMNSAFENTLKEEVFEFLDAGGDASVYINSSRTLVVKKLNIFNRDIFKMPQDNAGPPRGYSLALKNLGHLAVRFVMIDNLEIKVRNKDGFIENLLIEKAVVQKFVKVFFKEGYPEASARRGYVGILAEAIAERDINAAKLLIDEFLLAVRAIIMRGLVDWDIKSENYGYDPSVGRVGSFDFGKVVLWHEVDIGMAKIFIRNLQITRNDIYSWAKEKLPAQDALELKEYFEKSTKDIFRIREDFCFDIRKTVDELIEETSYGELNEDIMDIARASQVSPLPVCYIGSKKVRTEAIKLVAAYLRDSGKSYHDIAMLFAKIAFAKSEVEYRTGKLYQRSFIQQNIANLSLEDDRYCGIKMRATGGLVSLQDILVNNSYRGKELTSEDKISILLKAAEALLRYYSPQGDVYLSAAVAFGLDTSLRIDDRLNIERELSRIDFEGLTIKEKWFLKQIFRIEGENFEAKDLLLAIDKISESRLIPVFISLKDFIVNRVAGEFQVDISSLGGYVRKGREVELLLLLNRNLNISLENIFNALENVFGVRGAVMFLERVIFQSADVYPELKEDIFEYLQKIADNLDIKGYMIKCRENGGSDKKTNAYPLSIPTGIKIRLEDHFGKNWQSEATEAKGFRLEGKLPSQLSQSQAEVITKRLAELEQLLGRAPPSLA
ncbi:MAG: hypothetical protein WAQ07_01185, partial [Candidatus Omnitrophota bacterium]